tara:strand:+ start:452 stop:949 length:498 start_codon:yes stop_codon:yes gene_type:complete
MRNKAIKGLLAGVLVLFSVSCTHTEILADYSEYQSTLVFLEAKSMEVETLDIINQHRSSLGLVKLKYMSLIRAVAHSHNLNMIEIHQISHNGFDLRSGYLKSKTCALNVSENVSYGYSSAHTMVKAWLNSPAHKETIEGNSTHFDISIDSGSLGGKYATNIFIKK